MDEKQKKFLTMMIALAVIISIIVTLLIVNIGSPVQEKQEKENINTVIVQEKQDNSAVVTAVVKEKEGENE